MVQRPPRRAMPPSAKPRTRRQPQPAALVSAPCPRCNVRITTKNGYAIFICQCGWLIKVEPLQLLRVDGQPTVILDDVMSVAEPDDERGYGKVDQVMVHEAIRRVNENWQKRGIAKFKVDQLRGTFEMELDGERRVLNESAERARWRAAQGR